jgi:hypothetical protein
MSKYEVTTDLIIHCKIKIIVEVEHKGEAIDAAAAMLPSNFTDQAALWKADVKLKPPAGVTITSCKAYHFERAAGDEKVKAIK